MDKIKARQITYVVKTYMNHRAAEYYAILPYINYILDSYNPTDGTYIKPPSRADGYQEAPENIREAYTKQAEALYREVLATITQSEMAKITVTQS